MFYNVLVAWVVVIHPDVSSWMDGLEEKDAKSYELLGSALDELGDVGPALGRPLVDTIKASRYPNMKELRPPSAGRGVIRVLFAFDPQRQVVLLVAGDKSGQSENKPGQWKKWYRKAIPLADRRFEEHIELLEGDDDG